MKYTFTTTKLFDKGIKRCKRRGLPIEKLIDTINILVEDGILPEKYHQHKLSGKYKGYWECHIQPDWLLVWLQDDQRLILVFTDTGTHADLFGN